MMANDRKTCIAIEPSGPSPVLKLTDGCKRGMIGTGERETMAKRNYSLLGPDAKRAVELGLASAEWYHTDVPRKTMKELMKRSDMPAIRDTVIWLGSMLVLAVTAAWL